MARKDYEQYIHDLSEAGISDQARVNQYVKSLEEGIVIPRHVKDLDTIRTLRSVVKKFNRDVSAAEVKELIYSIEAGVPEKYLIDGLSFEQMGNVRAGYKDGVDVDIYLNPTYPAYVMFGARKMLKMGVAKKTVKEYIDIVVKRKNKRVYNQTYFEEEFRWYLEDGGLIDDVKSFVMEEDAGMRIKQMRAKLNEK